jgi:hypothetical protein
MTSTVVPQSVNEPMDWLASREAADPFEISVLIFASSLGPKPFATVALEQSSPFDAEPDLSA